MQLKKIKFFFTRKKIAKYFFIFGIFLFIILSIIQINKRNKVKKNIQKFESILSNLKQKSQKSFIEAKNFSEEKKNIYSVLINLKLAKVAVEKKNIKLAEKILSETLQIKIPKNIQDLINIRLARIQLFLNKTQKSIQTLKKINNKSWNPIIKQIKGDALLKQGNFLLAKKSFLKGIKTNKIEILKKILQSKIDNIPN